MSINKQHEMHDRRRSRNYGVLGALLGLIVLLFVVTLVKMGPEAGNPTGGASWGESLMNWVRE